MDVAKGLLAPPGKLTASFDGGDASPLEPVDATKAVNAIDVPDGTKKIVVQVAQGGDYWDYTQELSLAPGPPPLLSLAGTVNPGSFVAPLSNPNTTDASIELWIVLTQVRDATAEV